MTLKNLFILGSALAGAAYLKDKTRRDRFMGQARGLIDKVKARATEVAGDVKEKANDVKEKASEVVSSASQPATSNFASPGASGRSSYDASRTYR